MNRICQGILTGFLLPGIACSFGSKVYAQTTDLEAIDIQSPRYQINSKMYAPLTGQALVRITDLDNHSDIPRTTFADCLAPVNSNALSTVENHQLFDCKIHPSAWFSLTTDAIDHIEAKFPELVKQVYEKTELQKNIREQAPTVLIFSTGVIAGGLATFYMVSRFLPAFRDLNKTRMSGYGAGGVVAAVFTMLSGFQMAIAWHNMTTVQELKSHQIALYTNLFHLESQGKVITFDKTEISLSYEQIRDCYYQAIATMPPTT